MSLSLFGVLNQNPSSSPDSNKQPKPPELLGRVSTPLYDFRGYAQSPTFTPELPSNYRGCAPFTPELPSHTGVYHLSEAHSVPGFWVRVLLCVMFQGSGSGFCCVLCSRVLVRGPQLLSLWSFPSPTLQGTVGRRRTQGARTVLQVLSTCAFSARYRVQPFYTSSHAAVCSVTRT